MCLVKQKFGVFKNIVAIWLVCAKSGKNGTFGNICVAMMGGRRWRRQLEKCRENNKHLPLQLRH